MFSTVLVPNRGEFACRVIRPCDALNIATVAVYSDTVEDTPQVSMAIEVDHIGPFPALQSSLNQDSMFEVTPAADGYGFIGSRHQSIRRMGDKPHARMVEGSGGSL